MLWSRSRSERRNVVSNEASDVCQINFFNLAIDNWRGWGGWWGGFYIIIVILRLRTKACSRSWLKIVWPRLTPVTYKINPVSGEDLVTPWSSYVRGPMPSECVFQTGPLIQLVPRGVGAGKMNVLYFFLFSRKLRYLFSPSVWWVCSLAPGGLSGQTCLSAHAFDFLVMARCVIHRPPLSSLPPSSFWGAGAG